MSSTESQLNGFGDNVSVESVARTGIPSLSEVSGDEDYHKDNLDDMQSQLPDPDKVVGMTHSVPEDEHRKSSLRQSTEDSVKQDQDTVEQDQDTVKQDQDTVKQDEECVKQDELLFCPTPHGSYDTDLDSIELIEREASFRQILHLGPTNSLTRASSVLDNYWFAEWGAYLFSHGIYMAFLSFIYLILVYASLELLYYMTNKKSI